ncbi:hypothetical protein QYE76_048007 [Lolium multiflorum]|uniref:CCHC-type domain-containing protein n=1 Tax=Lolium multiflorum TaxID=4521 RepID=A0AAD8TPU4_LOLMU|nr:hypothetical protein QYE76_048007 [Lolium multiflorum]
MPVGFASLCFNCADLGHMDDMCSGKRCYLNNKSEDHAALQCTVSGTVAHGAPPLSFCTVSHLLHVTHLLIRHVPGPFRLHC